MILLKTEVNKTMDIMKCLFKKLTLVQHSPPFSGKTLPLEVLLYSVR